METPGFLGLSVGLESGSVKAKVSYLGLTLLYTIPTTDFSIDGLEIKLRDADFYAARADIYYGAKTLNQFTE